MAQGQANADIRAAVNAMVTPLVVVAFTAAEWLVVEGARLTGAEPLGVFLLASLVMVGLVVAGLAVAFALLDERLAKARAVRQPAPIALTARVRSLARAAGVGEPQILWTPDPGIDVRSALHPFGPNILLVTTGAVDRLATAELDAALARAVVDLRIKKGGVLATEGIKALFLLAVLGVLSLAPAEPVLFLVACLLNLAESVLRPLLGRWDAAQGDRIAAILCGDARALAAALDKLAERPGANAARAAALRAGAEAGVR